MHDGDSVPYTEAGYVVQLRPRATEEHPGMGSPDLTKPPTPTAGDAAHTVVKAGLAAIPIVGGPAAEIFAAIVVPPLTKRRDEWVRLIAEALKELQRRVDGFSVEALAQNDVFVTTLLNASQAAVRTHQEEKLEALRNAVLNAGLPNPPEEDLQLMFVRFIDELTAWHLRVLKFFDDPRAWGRARGITFPDWISASAAAALNHAFPDLEKRGDFGLQLVRDLFARGLMSTESINVMVTAEGIFASRATAMGKQFLAFIASPVAMPPG